MSQQTEWTAESREPGWLGRLVAPEGGGRPSTTAFLVALLGLAAFVASLTLDWVSVTLPQNFQGGGIIEGQTFGQSLVNVSSLGEVYALAGIALFGFVGSVITRPDAALRMRMGVTGVAIGLLGLVAAGNLNLQNRALEQWVGPIFAPGEAQATAALEAGLFCAYAAVALPAVAVWLVARPAARATRAAAPPEAAVGGQGVTEEPAEESVPAPPNRWVSVGGLSVSPSEPVDLSVTPDAWPR